MNSIKTNQKVNKRERKHKSPKLELKKRSSHHQGPQTPKRLRGSYEYCANTFET